MESDHAVAENVDERRKEKKIKESYGIACLINGRFMQVKLKEDNMKANLI